MSRPERRRGQWPRGARIVRRAVYTGRGGRCTSGGMRGRRGAGGRVASPRRPLTPRPGPGVPARAVGARGADGCGEPRLWPARTWRVIYEVKVLKRGHQLEPDPALCVLLGVLLWKLNFNPAIKPKSETHSLAVRGAAAGRVASAGIRFMERRSARALIPRRPGPFQAPPAPASPGRSPASGPHLASPGARRPDPRGISLQRGRSPALEPPNPARLRPGAPSAGAGRALLCKEAGERGEGSAKMGGKGERREEGGGREGGEEGK